MSDPIRFKPSKPTRDWAQRHQWQQAPTKPNSHPIQVKGNPDARQTEAPTEPNIRPLPVKVNPDAQETRAPTEPSSHPDPIKVKSDARQTDRSTVPTPATTLYGPDQAVVHAPQPVIPSASSSGGQKESQPAQPWFMWGFWLLLVLFFLFCCWRGVYRAGGLSRGEMPRGVIHTSHLTRAFEHSEQVMTDLAALSSLDCHLSRSLSPISMEEYGPTVNVAANLETIVFAHLLPHAKDAARKARCTKLRIFHGSLIKAQEALETFLGGLRSLYQRMQEHETECNGGLAAIEESIKSKSADAGALKSIIWGSPNGKVEAMEKSQKCRQSLHQRRQQLHADIQVLQSEIKRYSTLRMQFGHINTKVIKTLPSPQADDNIQCDASEIDLIVTALSRAIEGAADSEAKIQEARAFYNSI